MRRSADLKLKVHVVVVCDDDIALDEVVSELDYAFTDTTGKAQIVDTEILDYEIEDG